MGEQSFGAQVRRYRLAATLTQEELAERAGLSVRGLKYLEQDARRPLPDTVRRLAAALSLTPEQRAALVARAVHSPRGGAALPAPTNLPASSTTFIGRRQELAELQ